MTTLAEMTKKHEDFKSRLVDEVFGKDNKGKIQMEKVTMLIWQFRDDPNVVRFMAQFVAKYAGSRDTFDGIEFYLPQLAHMIIHLEANWDDAILERFALVISQHSMHFALQLNWIVCGAMEDYQPETPDGEPNPAYNKLFYSRCVKLISNIERCVVYGSPRTHELRELFEGGKISREEYELLEQADRRFNATQIASRHVSLGESVVGFDFGAAAGGGGGENLVGSSGSGAGGAGSGYLSSDSVHSDGSSYKRSSHFGGELMYKRHVRTASYKRKQWKTRYFAVSERMLFCYNHHPSQGGELRRAMPLEGAEIREANPAKYNFMFEVENQHFLFRMRAASDDEKKMWMDMLKMESQGKALYPEEIDVARNGVTVRNEEEDGDGPESSQKIGMQDLSKSQRARYHFYKTERDFIRAICDVAEDLRFLDRPERKKLAPVLMRDLEIPPCSYIPLCKSTDLWRRVHIAKWKDVRVFNTKARCPTMMFFVTKRGETLATRNGLIDKSLDVAEYLHLRYEVPDNHPATILEEDPKENEHENDEDENDQYSPNNANANTNANTNGTGMKRSGSSTMLWSVEDEHHDQDSNSLLKPPNSPNSSHNTTSNPNNSSSPSSPHHPTKGNRQVKRFVRENLVKMPSKIAMRIESRRSFRSPTVNAAASSNNNPNNNTTNTTNDPNNPLSSSSIIIDEDDQSIGSTGAGSILTHDGVVVTENDDYGIDKESLDRAKTIITGGETWSEKSARLLREYFEEDNTPPASDSEGTTTEIVGLISKSNDDLRQEVFVMQMIHFYKSIFARAKLPLWLRTYRLLSTSKDTGLIELITDATSIDGLKKADGYPENDPNLRSYFEKVYGPPESDSFKAAQRNFMLSLCGYSLVSYFLGLKDRHNGNIMIDIHGHLIFIDFGFAFGMAPGHEFSMERAPFKLTMDYMNVMGGRDSDVFKEFKRLFLEGFQAARNNSLVALGLVEIMMYKSNFPCFSGSRYGNGVSLKKFENRLMLNVPDVLVNKRILKLVDQSIDHTGTYLYDVFQKKTNGYAI